MASDLAGVSGSSAAKPSIARIIAFEHLNDATGVFPVAGLPGFFKFSTSIIGNILVNGAGFCFNEKHECFLHVGQHLIIVSQ